MIPQTPRHDFLHELHKLLRPALYLEIGVQTGRSLAQAVPPTFATGVDPAPQVSVPIAVAHDILEMTSDDFFDGVAAVGHYPPIDLAFIDGMHLVEYALRDFIGVERLARPDRRTVAVFDDVLPYSPDIAGRTPLPGDWAGDVWKVDPILAQYRPDLTRILVDVDPTGVMVVLDLDPAHEPGQLGAMVTHPQFSSTPWFTDLPLFPEQPWVSRSTAVQPGKALDLIRQHLRITEA